MFKVCLNFYHSMRSQFNCATLGFCRYLADKQVSSSDTFWSKNEDRRDERLTGIGRAAFRYLQSVKTAAGTKEVRR